MHFFLPHLCSAHIRFILRSHAGAAWQFLLLFSPFFCCVLFIKNHSSSLCLSLFVSRSQAHTDTHTHLSFFPCTYCMSLRQTVSVIGLFFSSPVWCTETHTHPCTHIQSMHTHAQTHTEFDLWRRFSADCCWGRRSAAMRAFLFGPVRVCRAGVWLDTSWY